ncbi:MAG: type IV pilus twitching motility protein PilT [Sandaracinaceae bacterium]
MSGGDAASGRATEAMVRILKGSLAAGASDIHLRVGRPPVVRLQGELRPLDHPPLSGGFIAHIRDTLAAEAQVDPAALGRRTQGNFACEVPDVGRFRVHHYRQGGTAALALRTVPHPVPDFAALRIPPVAKRLASVERGLVLVTGATGNGKSTTIASLLSHLNQEVSKHIVTIEEPIEFILQDRRSTFTQREVGRDVEDMRTGLLGALREDPDWIFVGEIRELHEFELALSAAEAGHVVVSTLHSQDTSRALSRMIHFFAEGHRETARQRLADAVAGVVSQRLVPRRGARERILVTEVLLRAPTIQDCIRDASRFRGLHAALEAGTGEYGTHSFDQQLLSMVRDGLIAEDTARAAATKPNDLVRAIHLGGGAGAHRKSARRAG